MNRSLTLAALLERGVPCGVDAWQSEAGGRASLCAALTDGRRQGQLGRDFGDEPTFLLLPDLVAPGRIEVDALARLLPDAPDYARGFIGIAWHVQGAGDAFECFYLRPTNGRSHAPPPPRDMRAIQYFAYPDHKFDRLRDTDPGRYEAGADIGLDRWHHLVVDLTGPGPRLEVDGQTVLTLDAALQPARPGGIGLWVDIGTEGHFDCLEIRTE